MAIIVYNRKNDDHTHDNNNYPIFRGSGILGNPYTHLPLRGTRAIYHVRTREEAIDRYSGYFDLEYEHNPAFRNVVDEIYSHYKKGEDVYLECVCHPSRCHGDIIKEKLEKRLLKEKVAEIRARKRQKNEKQMGEVL